MLELSCVHLRSAPSEVCVQADTHLKVRVIGGFRRGGQGGSVPPLSFHLKNWMDPFFIHSLLLFLVFGRYY